MGRMWTKGGVYSSAPYQNEAELEAAVVEVQTELFGRDRIYLDVKRKIGARGGLRNVPDGYLIDLTGMKPLLFVVENELAAHDPLRHIAVQILQFSLSFEAEPRAVKKILLEALQAAPAAEKKCEEYVRSRGYRNIDHLLEVLVEGSFSALVIIDELLDNLESVLARRFQFGVEVLEVSRYRNQAGDFAYHFEPFLADLAGEEHDVVTSPAANGVALAGTTDVDTVVVPAREDGFKDVFLGENRWYAVRLHGSMRPQIKYTAVYRVAPVSAITHIAPVNSIEPWKDSGKYVINFKGPAKEIRAIPVVPRGRVKPLQNLRYTTRERLEQAKSLDDIWPQVARTDA